MVTSNNSSKRPINPYVRIGASMLFKVKNHRQLETRILDFNNNKKFYKKKLILAYMSLERFDFSKSCKKYLAVINKTL